MPKNNDPLSRPLAVCLIAAICCLLWGSAAPMIKTGYELFSIQESDVWSMILFAGCRFALAGILVILFSSAAERKFLWPKKTSWPSVVKLSAVQTVIQYLLFYIGVANCSGVHSAILTGASSLWAILISCFILRQEEVTPGKMIGCALGFGGILLMNITGAGGGVTLTGEGFLLLTGVSGGLSSVLIRRYSQHERPVTLSGWQFLIGGLFMILCALGMGGRLGLASVPALGTLLYLGFLSAVAYSLWSVLLAHNPVSNVAVYGFMTPVFGVLLSALLLGEVRQAFTPITLGALILVSAGIVAVNRYGNHSCTKRHKESTKSV